MHKKDALGKYGEALAARFLTNNGWTILDRNWRATGGELDIVARRGEVLAVCEVKTRRSARFGSPAEAVTPDKLQRLRRLAGVWIAMHDEHASTIRIDVIAILVDDAGMTRMQHIEGVY